MKMYDWRSALDPLERAQVREIESRLTVINAERNKLRKEREILVNRGTQRAKLRLKTKVATMAAWKEFA